MRAAWAVPVLAGGLVGCAGGGPVCTGGSTVAVSPASGVADHAAAVPGNQLKFTATSAPTASPGCAVPTYILLLQPAWSSSDPLDVTISSAPDGTNGTATCMNATAGAVTLTATGGSGSAAYVRTATLTCK